MPPTPPSPGPVVQNPLVDPTIPPLLDEAHIPPIAHIPTSCISCPPASPPYPDILPSVIFRPTPRIRSRSHEQVFSRVTTPYNADAFDSLLEKHNLTTSYPNLARNLRNGFPMAEFPPLKKTVIFPNHPSVDDHRAAIQEYLDEEVAAKRMSGPYSREELEDIVKGPFQCSPLVVSVQPQGIGEPDKIRICRHLSKSSAKNPSTNDHVDKDKFPTRFSSATEMADTVSPPPSPPHT